MKDQFVAQLGGVSSIHIPRQETISLKVLEELKCLESSEHCNKTDPSLVYSSGSIFSAQSGGIIVIRPIQAPLKEEKQYTLYPLHPNYNDHISTTLYARVKASFINTLRPPVASR